MKQGGVSSRVALLLRSTEPQPSLSDLSSTSPQSIINNNNIILPSLLPYIGGRKQVVNNKIKLKPTKKSRGPPLSSREKIISCKKITSLFSHQGGRVTKIMERTQKYGPNMKTQNMESSNFVHPWQPQKWVKPPFVCLFACFVVRFRTNIKT
jgi:hypothetical protein